MIVDAHCHAWRRWPYRPEVPDPESRGRLDGLLFEMNGAGIDRAVVICAGIDHNPDNNADVAADIAPHGDRFVMFADVDSRWTATHHGPGAAGRLSALADRHNLRGLTHYLSEDGAEQGAWLLSPDGTAFMQEIDDRRLILSLACAPHQMPAIAALADRHPRVPILLHHMARVRDVFPGRSGVLDLLSMARCENVFVKISGFGYAAGTGAAYPYDDLGWIVRVIAEAFGASRMVWGSDYPVSRRYMTYRQTLDCVLRQCGFMSRGDIDAVLGGTMQGLLAAAGPQS